MAFPLGGVVGAVRSLEQECYSACLFTFLELLVYRHYADFLPALFVGRFYCLFAVRQARGLVVQGKAYGVQDGGFSVSFR